MVEGKIHEYLEPKRKSELVRTVGAIVDQHRERREQEMKIVTAAGLAAGAIHVVVTRQQEIRTKRNYEHQKKAGKCSHFALFLSLLDYFRFYWSVFLRRR